MERSVMERQGQRSRKGRHSEEEIEAAILGVPDEFSRELFCLVFRPCAMRTSSRDIEKMLLARVLKECKNRSIDLVVARLTYSISQIELGSVRNASRAAGALERQRTILEFAQTRRWPSPRLEYRNLTWGVVSELIECRASLGRCAFEDRVLSHEDCMPAGGPVMRSELARARALRITWHAYHKSWKEPYEWAFGHCFDALREANRKVIRRLGGAVSATEAAGWRTP
ncbi:hypothetical protein QLQ15_13440 [Lysobacter sp. LF1]|uniref:Uncharacterized protein n=1 Tax=Lysobacter stagni TaxID=3045172 RepID=A0ABT6XID3_9GAMM|nr:hypothetical protein [Lysobacter sp. LF1]MDI9239910.1 hypothetical protein [Lysobacter sp. LF1]